MTPNRSIELTCPGKPGHVRTYEYLAFARTMYEVLKVPDPVGRSSRDLWLKELLESKEFRDVHSMYGDYYPKFRDYVNASFTAPLLPAAGVGV